MMTSSKFSFRNRPQGPPPICVHKLKMFPTPPFPTEEFEAYWSYAGTTADASPFVIGEVLRISQHPLIPTRWTGSLHRPAWSIFLFVDTVDWRASFDAEQELRENGIVTAHQSTPGVPYSGVERYDTLDLTFPDDTGVGQFGLRITQ